MEPHASIQFISRDLNRIHERISREGWDVEQDGLLVKVVLPQKHTGKFFRLLLYCYGYPRSPIEATFIPDPIRSNVVLWPYDNEGIFRIFTSLNRIPFICMAGLKSYSPEEDSPLTPYMLCDINIANIITRIYQKINEKTCNFIEFGVDA